MLLIKSLQCVHIPNMHLDFHMAMICFSGFFLVKKWNFLFSSSNTLAFYIASCGFSGSCDLPLIFSHNRKLTVSSQNPRCFYIWLEKDSLDVNHTTVNTICGKYRFIFYHQHAYIIHCTSVFFIYSSVIVAIWKMHATGAFPQEVRSQYLLGICSNSYILM